MDLMLARAPISVIKITIQKPPSYTKNNRHICALFVAQVQQSVCFFIERIYVHLQSVKTYLYP